MNRLMKEVEYEINLQICDKVDCEAAIVIRGAVRLDVVLQYYRG